MSRSRERAFGLGRAGQLFEPPADLQLWTTNDGVAWQREPGLPSIPDAVVYRVADIAATDDRLVVVGWAEVTGADGLRNFAYVSPVAASTATPNDTRPTPTASLAATPPPTGPVASSIDPVVLLRVEIRGDVSVGRVPSLTVYRDGTVLRRDLGSGRITRLTPAGVGLLLVPAMDSDLLVTSGEIRPDPAYQAGFITYTIDLRRGEEIVRRSTTNSLTSATRTEAERIIALAKHLDDLESWLPADAWATGPASATRYVASHFLLKVTVFEKQPGVDYRRRPLDVSDVDWPLGGRLEDFGDALAKPPLGAGSASRCGLVTLVEFRAVDRALGLAPTTQEAERMVTELDWAAARSRVTVSLAPLLPDDPPDCAVDGSWP